MFCVTDFEMVSESEIESESDWVTIDCIAMLSEIGIESASL